MNAENIYRTEILPEVLELAKKINAKLKSNGSPPEIKGWKVWYSNIIERPDFLFIGINPNNVPEDIDYFGSSALEIDELKVQLEPDEDIRYNSDTNWSLSVFTREAFQNAGITIAHNVKINYYYLGTKDLTTLNNLSKDKYIGKDLKMELDFQSAKWTKKVIELINPKVIICEGSKAFNDLVIHELKQEKEIINIMINEGNLRKALFKDIPVIGYSRAWERSSEDKRTEILGEFSELLTETKNEYLK